MSNFMVTWEIEKAFENSLYTSIVVQKNVLFCHIIIKKKKIHIYAGILSYDKTVCTYL